jgi:PQQ-like domain
MYHGDPSHSGLSQSMPDVSGSPKVIESIRLDGAVYASPIAVDGVIVVATENDSVYGFDARGQQLWRAKVGSPSPGPGAGLRRHRPAGHHRHPDLQRADRRRLRRRGARREGRARPDRA